jgi:hypothetical protein
LKSTIVQVVAPAYDDVEQASISEEQLFSSSDDSSDVKYIKTVKFPNVECLEDLPEVTAVSAAEQQMNLIDHGWWEVLTTEPSSLGIYDVPIDEDARLRAITHFRLEELYYEAQYNAQWNLRGRATNVDLESVASFEAATTSVMAMVDPDLVQRIDTNMV